MAKKKSLVDRIAHPFQDDEGLAPEADKESAGEHEEQEAAVKGKADPAADYKNHPKFSKFKRGN